MDESTAPAGTATAPTAASLELCGAIQALMEAAAVSPAATLSEVREALLRDVFIGNGEMLYPQDRTSLVIELDELIERHGAQTPARSYTPGPST